jgi:putative membrane protein
MRLTFKSGMLLAGAGLFITLSGPAIAQKSDDATNFNGVQRRDDGHFAREAAMGGMMEVELGRIAVQKSSNDKVKEFGQRMIDDHSKVGEELKGIAAKNNFNIPAQLDERHKAIVNGYVNMSATEFDRSYMRDMVKDHQTDIAEFQKEANSGMNADLKSWATTTLPTLQEHLRIAKETESSLSVTSRR